MSNTLKVAISGILFLGNISIQQSGIQDIESDSSFVSSNISSSKWGWTISFGMKKANAQTCWTVDGEVICNPVTNGDATHLEDTTYDQTHNCISEVFEPTKPSATHNIGWANDANGNEYYKPGWDFHNQTSQSISVIPFKKGKVISTKVISGGYEVVIQDTQENNSSLIYAYRYKGFTSINSTTLAGATLNESNAIGSLAPGKTMEISAFRHLSTYNEYVASGDARSEGILDLNEVGEVTGVTCTY